MIVTITNDFHDTEARVANAARVRRKLCGIDDCACSGSGLSTRGPQRTDDGRRIAIDPHSGGGAVEVWIED